MGKSRYTPLVKLKKKGLDEAERSLIAANNEVAGASDRLNHAYMTLASLSLPSQGSVRELSQANMMIQAQHHLINQSKEALIEAQNKLVRIRSAFELAMVEFEKFKYLEVQEVNEEMKKLKIADAKMLDEIGILIYKRETE